MRNFDLWNMVAHGGPDTATSTSSSAPPQWVQDAQQYVTNLGQNMTSPFTATPAYSVAGFNADQQQAQQGYRDMYTNAQNGTAPTGQASFNTAQAAQLSPGEIQQFQNPYNQQVLDNTYRNMRQQYDTQDADFGAKMAAAGAYGGSRQAVGQALNQQNFQNNVSSTAANLMSQGFDKASALAMQNAQMRQQAALQNAQSANQMGMYNAGSQLNAYNAQNSQMLTALQALMNSGNQQQQLSQSAIDAPWTALQRLTGATPSLNNTGTNTTSTQPVQSNTAGTVIGGLSVLASLLSDEDEKVNKQKLGKDPQTGLDLYAYDYKADVDKAQKDGSPMPPKRVGPMAGDIAKQDPGSVKKVGGKKVVVTRNAALKQLMGVGDE